MTWLLVTTTPSGADQHAGAERVLDALARDAEPLAEQPPEERVVEEGRDHLLDPVPHIDINHGGGRPLHHRREGLLHRHGALGHRALLRGGGRAKRQQRQDGQPKPPCHIYLVILPRLPFFALVFWIR